MSKTLSNLIQARISESEHRLFTEAAAADARNFSVWARRHLQDAAQQAQGLQWRPDDPNERLTRATRIAVDPALFASIQDAAQHDYQSTNSWVRERLMRAAVRELHDRMHRPLYSGQWAKEGGLD